MSLNCSKTGDVQSKALLDKMKISIISICSLLLIICCKNIYAQDTLLYKVVSVDSIEMPELNYIIT